MIPLRDTIRSGSFPVINSLIIAINVGVYILEVAQGPRLSAFLFTYGLVPARYSIAEIAGHFSFRQQAFSFLSFQFVHGDFWHLLGNMWSLYIFGDNVEDRLGPLRYGGFYLACGIASGLSHLFVNWYSQVPTVGASGAIAGIMGAYFLLYPRARILTLIPIFFFPYFVELPAMVFLGIWFLLQFLSAAATPAQGGGVAWWAHIGGFLFGILVAWYFSGRRAESRSAAPRAARPQIVTVRGRSGSPHLFGDLHITPQQSRSGTSKPVTIPWGFHTRRLNIRVPPGIRDGAMLRLAGMGRFVSGGQSGDLFLKVHIT